MNPNMGSILIGELGEPAYAELSQFLGDIETAKSNFAKRNVIVDKLEEITTADGGKARLISGSQTSRDTTYDKWIGVFEGPPTV
jgi:hypothetical protein